MPEPEVLVSVIIPAYKAADYIEETIRSVASQSYPSIEILVVDDGSPDDQNEVITSLQKNIPNLRLITQENAGVSAARNHGYRESKGEFLAFLDSDDTWKPNRVGAFLQKFESGDFGLVHSDVEIINEDSIPNGEINSGLEGQVLDNLLLWDECVIPAPSSILVKREVIEAVGLFDTELSTAADQEFFFRVANKYKVGRIPETLGGYRIHGDNMSKNVPLLEKDHLLAYQKAHSNKLFKSWSFKRKCFSNMYLIIGASYYGDYNRKLKGSKIILKALWVYAPNLLKVLSKIAKS